MKRLSFLNNILFPIQCILCSKEWAYLCSSCKKSLHIHPDICPCCHRSSAHFLVCTHCKGSTPLTWCIVWFSYTWGIKKLIHLLKYKYISTASSFLAKQLFRHIQTHALVNQYDSTTIIICPVPTHPLKVLLNRWYDHISLLSRHLWEYSSLPIYNLLTKVRYTASQIWRSKTQRYNNLQWSFWISGKYTLWSLEGTETILLIDDVVTSWSTLLHAARCLKEKWPLLTIRAAVLSRNMR